MQAPDDRDGGVLTADLLAVVASVVLVLAVVFSPAAAIRPLAIGVGLLFVLVVPGYALVAAVFPRAGDAAFGTSSGTSWLARLGLSVVGSVVAVAVVGGVLDFTVWEFRQRAVITGLSLLTLVSTAAAWYRRRHLPVGVQAGVTESDIGARTRGVTGTNLTGILLTVVVLVATAGAIGVVASESTASGTVTELYVLGQDESGQLVAESYPSNLTAGEPVTVGVGVGTTREMGFEGRVVATIERVTADAETTRITESQRLGSFDVQVSGGERSVRRHTVEPTLAGDRLRLTYRLYEAGSETPLRRAQIWVSVTQT